MRSTIVCLAAALLAGAASAQCLFSSVSTQSVGSSCNAPSTGFCAIAAMPVSLTPTLNTTNCSLTIQLTAFEGCGATVPLRVLALGFQPASVPLPEFGATCALHIAPIVLLADTTGTFVLPLPTSTASLGFYAQGAALSVPPFGANILAFSNGLSVNLQ